MNKYAILLLSTLSCSVFAEESDPFKAELQLGLLNTSGNTQTSSLTSKLDARQDLTNWRNQYILEGLYSENEVAITNEEGDEVRREQQTVAQRVFGSGKAEYKLQKEHSGLFVFGSYENDRFSGFDYQSTLAVGYSDRLIDTERSTLDYSVGPGVAINRTEDTLVDGLITEEGEEVTTGVVRAAFEYIFQISENAKFTQTFSSNLSVDTSENSQTRAESALSANINSSMAMKLSYLINQNTHVPADRKHADTQTAVTLVFSI